MKSLLRISVIIALVGLPQYLWSSNGSLYQDSIVTLVENTISDPA